MKPQPILFLDIDGVLNSKRWYDDPRARGGCRVENLDPACCAELDRVCELTGCVLVLSSSWRYPVNGEEMVPFVDAFLYDRGCRHTRFKGRTPLHTEIHPNAQTVPIPGHPGSRMFEDEVRSLEIQRWIDNSGFEFGSFAIIDDDADMAHLAHRLVRTNNAVGLTRANGDALIALLTKDVG